MWSAGPGDDQARFLADLRALRDMAAIGYDELSARAHYPSDVLKEAENGPLLPGLPVLTAYVRACEGDVLDWEERWRRLAEVPEDPDLPVRPPGASPAAAAGARAGVSVAPPDVYDPERIKAALRGGQGRSEHSGRRTGDPAISSPTRGYEFPDRGPAGWSLGGSHDNGGSQDGNGLDTSADLDTGESPGAGSGWDSSPSWDAEADQTITMANGNHSGKHQARGPFDAAIVEMPDSADRAKQTGQFRWLPDAEPAPQAADTESTDDVPAPPERTDFWAPSVTAASGDLQPPSAPLRRIEEQELTQASSAPVPAFAETAGTSAAPVTSELTQRLGTDAVPSAVSATTPPQVSAEPARFTRTAGSGTAQPTSPKPADHGKDGFFTARLLVIIVIAALIGSALVLLLK